MTKALSLHTCITMLMVLMAIRANAQISEGGMPPSFGYASMTKTGVATYMANINVDVAKLKKEDAITDQYDMPARVAHIIDVDLSVDNAGTWTTLPNGQRIWQLKIKSKGALATMLYYNKFDIPAGGKLFIYSADRSHIIGAYTNKTNPGKGKFATEAVAGDEIVLEYAAPAGTLLADVPDISISGVGYCYNHITVQTKALGTGFNESGACQVNINCTEGNEWQHQKRGVVMAIIKIGDKSFTCSGSLLNNTAEDMSPLLLSSRHCFFDESNKPAEFSQILFYFDYETPGCTYTDSEPETKTMTGASLLVDIPTAGGSDGILLQLDNLIPSSYKAYYNGWDVSGSIPQNGVCIHHPKGDVKKISTYASPATSSTWSYTNTTTNTTVTGATNAHWSIVFDKTDNGYGVIERGSSGAPLFNEAGLVAGTLTGGNSSCTYLKGNNMFGKLLQHWDQYPQKMNAFLDPLNTGVKILKGRYADNTLFVDFDAPEATVSEGDSVKFRNLSYGADTYDWTFEGGEPQLSTDKHPAIKYKEAGTYAVTLVINKGMANELRITKNSYVIVEKRRGSLVDNSLKASLSDDKKSMVLAWQYSGQADDDVAAIQQDMEIKSDFWFDIYRDGDLLASEITTNTYTDNKLVLLRGVHCYKVHAVFKCGADTQQSNEACCDLPESDDLVVLSYNKSANQLDILPKAMLRSVKVYDLNGRLQASFEAINSLLIFNISTSHWARGVNVIRVETEAGIAKYKISLR